MSYVNAITKVKNADQIILEILGKESGFEPLIDELREFLINEYSSKREVKDSQDFSIKSISRISNVGLINLDEELSFEQNDLNIFYGQNGVGKSTIYKSLTVPFATKHPYKIIPKNNDQSLAVDIKINYIKHANDQECEYDHHQNIRTDLSVQIFDSKVSIYSVNNSLENHFELSHLRVEAFDLTTDFLKEKETEIAARKVQINSELSKQTDDLLIKNIKIDEDSLKKYLIDSEKKELNRDVAKQLQEFEQEKSRLNSNTYEKDLETLRNFNEKLTSIIDRLVDKNSSTTVFSSESIDRENAVIERNIIEKKALESGDLNLLISEVPSEWFKSEFWRYHVHNAIKFIDSFDSELSSCPLCLSDITIVDKRELFAKYRSVYSRKDFIPAKGTNISSHMEAKSKTYEDLVNVIEEVDSGNLLLKSENTFKTLFTLDFDSYKKSISDLKQFAETIKDCHINLCEISFKEKEQEDHSTIVLNLLSVQSQCLKNIELIEGKLNDKTGEMKILNEEILSLKQDVLIFSNLDLIKTYESNQKIIEDGDIQIDYIRKVKQKISAQKTLFVKNESMTEFKSALHDHYKELGFFKHSQILADNVKAKTNDGVTAREYNFYDLALREVLSEGEMKIHALADFLTEAKLRNDRSVFIFDDPVNSLDEEYIVYVAWALKKLSETNQVFVFTHNLLFLNTLVEDENKEIFYIQKDVTPQLKFCKKSEISSVKKDFEKIQKKHALVVNDGRSDDIGNIYDRMNGYIELYVEQHLFNKVVRRYRKSVALRPLEKFVFNNDMLSLINDLVRRINTFGDKHRLDGAPNPTFEDLDVDFSKLKTLHKLAGMSC